MRPSSKLEREESCRGLQISKANKTKYESWGSKCGRGQIGHISFNFYVRYIYISTLFITTDQLHKHVYDHASAEELKNDIKIMAVAGWIFKAERDGGAQRQ